MNGPRFLGACLVVLASVLLLPRPSHASYSQSDLAGPWRSQTLASGPGEPFWERGQAFITPGGALTLYAIDNHGDRDTVFGTLVLEADGVVTMTEQPAFHGALDLGKTVFAGTDTWWEDGSSQLRLVVKTIGGYGTTDLAGIWEFNSIVSGPGAPWWIRGRLNLAANGSFSGTLTESTGATAPASGTMAVTPDGAITLSIAPGALGWLDAGHTVLIMTNTWSDGSSELITGLRMAASYAQSDLAGTWEIRSLATGPAAPWWSRGRIVVGTDGSFSGSMMEQTGGLWPVSGTLTLAPDGVIARSGSTVLRGVLDAGRTVMVWTDTWSSGSPGTTEMVVGVRTDGSTADVPPATATPFALERVRPNPTRAGALAIRFTLADASAARLELIDVAGRSVAAREVGALGAGSHVVALGAGERMRPGLYFVRLRQGGSERVERVTVVE